MFEPVDGEAAEVAMEQLEVIEDTIGQALGEGAILAADDRPILCRALAHFAELGAFGFRMFDIFLHAHRVSPSLRLSMTL